MPQSNIQRVFQASTPAPTFGQLFGQALVRNIGASARESRQERAEFLSIAPSLINKGLLETTTGDDPDILKVGGKPVRIGGIGVKPSKPVADVEKQLDILTKSTKLRERNLPTVSDLTKAYSEPGGLGYEIQLRWADRIAGAKSDAEADQLIAQRDNEFTQGLQSFINKARNNPGSLSFSPQGGAQIMVKDKDGGVRPATMEEVKSGNFTPAVSSVGKDNIFSNKKKADGSSIINQVFKVGQAAANVDNKAFKLGQFAGSAADEARKLQLGTLNEIGKLPSRAVGAALTAGNIGTDFVSGLTGVPFGKVPDYAVNEFLGGNAFTPREGDLFDPTALLNLLRTGNVVGAEQLQAPQTLTPQSPNLSQFGSAL